jgi:23S rRNA (uracil1939-C5)-methyltransferase
MAVPGEVLTLGIDKAAVGGRMIARADGLVVLVAGAIPGERVRARVDRIGRGVAYATVVEIEAGSPDRREPAGDPDCGGCLYAHVSYARQLELKSQLLADAFARIGRLELPEAVRVAASPEEGYRLRARLHVRGGALGFFREGTHDLCDARQTRQLLPATSDALGRLVPALTAAGSRGSAEVELAENVGATERVVHIEPIGESAPLSPEACERAAAMTGLTGVSAPGAVWGATHVTDAVRAGAGRPVSIRRHVLSFFQGNRFLVDALVEHVVSQLPERKDVIDLYAGVGLFAVAAAAGRGARVTAVEGDRIAASDLAANAAGASGAVVPVHGPVEEFLRTARSAATIIIDPPRTGLSRSALGGLLALRASRLVYVSCDPATLARDARRIVDDGYELLRADAFDLFPNTPHVETVVVFNRRGKGEP